MLRQTRSAGKRPALTPLSTNTTVGLSKKRGLPADQDEFVDTPTKKPAKRRAKKQQDDDDDDDFEPSGSRTPPKKKGRSQPVLSEEESEGEDEEEYVSEDDDLDDQNDDDATKASPSEPTIDGTKKKRATPRAAIPLKFNLESFTALDIGEAGPVHRLPLVDEARCHDEFNRRWQKGIRFRRRKALGPDGYAHFTRDQLTWWLATSEEEVWQLTQLAYTEERQRVLGGTFLGLYKFTDLPRPTHEEMEMWQVYGDMLDTYGRLDKLYGGSGSACMESHGTYSRWHYYERCMRRFLANVSVELDTKHSEHLRHALRPGVTMNIRTCAVLDPQRHSHIEIITLEGLFIDVMQTFDRLYIPSGTRVGDSVEAREASIAASDNDMTWKGLNHSTCFLQATRPGGDPKVLQLEAQGWDCEICHQEDRKQLGCWTGTDKRCLDYLPLQNKWVCTRCVGVVVQNELRKSFPDLKTLQRRREGGDPGSRQRNALLLRMSSISLAEYRQLLATQEHKCPVCLRVNLAEGKDAWRPNSMQEMFPDQAYMCNDCVAARSHSRNSKLSDQALVDMRRAFYDEEMQAANKTGSGNGQRNKDIRQEKFDLMHSQDMCCPGCNTKPWGDITKPDDITKALHGSAQDIPFGDRAMMCRLCGLWLQNQIKKPMTKKVFHEKLAARHQKYADANENCDNAWACRKVVFITNLYLGL
ncbi:hypothetical protein TI39_contig5851g00011 [Zymoseptoria brevis]|uniref:Uncharacterized protein n=1 Tax=Zymoseptoria brevis TaxID=1047168 RepID=A0A0F4G528_9PEZI|nr:hypothetical protein TI39_contig5851g00011 [Zymoseptoria brevis]